MNTILLRTAQAIPLLVATLALTNQGMSETARAASLDDFATENERAMDKMMTAMNITLSGNVDRDFVAMMVPHHQGAIDMAVAELRYGKDETLRRMAQEIIVEQQQEIVAMHLTADRLPRAAFVRLNPSDLCTSRSSTKHTRDLHVQGN